MSPEILGSIFSSTALAVGLILAAAGFGSALGWGLICAKVIEGIARQPELRGQLVTNMFIFAGLMESFPFIILAFAMWFVFANPFVGALEAALQAVGA